MEKNTARNVETEENQTLLDDNDYSVTVKYQTYKTRWYVLGLFVLLATSQLCLWNTWGPIADTATTVLGWTDADIALLTNWGCITFVCSAFFYSWLMDVKDKPTLGLKWSLTLGAGFLFTGTAIRCIPVSIGNLKWLMHCGHIMIGFGGPVMMAAPALLSATWFPPHQRTTSTAVATSASYLGPAVAYLICPAVVSEVDHSNSSNISNRSLTDGLDKDIKQQHIDEIIRLMIIEFAVMSALFLCVLVYFPARPKTPPSASAHQAREDFKTGISILVKSRHFWLPCLCYGVSNGIFYAWQSQLVVVFGDAQNVEQDTSGWIGFSSNIAGVVGAILFGRVIDYAGGKMRSVLMVLAFCAAGFAVWFILLCLDVINFNIASLYASSIAFGFTVNAMVPVYFEMTVEGMFPISEGIVTCAMTWLMNFVCLIALLTLMVHDTAVSWLNWAALGGVLFCLPLLLIHKERYNRLSLDLQKELTEDDIIT